MIIETLFIISFILAFIHMCYWFYENNKSLHGFFSCISWSDFCVEEGYSFYEKIIVTIIQILSISFITLICFSMLPALLALFLFCVSAIAVFITVGIFFLIIVPWSYIINIFLPGTFDYVIQNLHKFF